MSSHKPPSLDERTRRGTVVLEGDLEMVAEREFTAPRARVYEAMNDPTLLPKWWGPARLTTTVERYEVRPGGRWRVLQQEPDGTVHAFRGEFQVVEAPKRVVSTFEYEGAPGQILTQTVEFDGQGGRTLVRVRVRFPNAASRRAMIESGMETGMREGWARLDILLGDRGGE